MKFIKQNSPIGSADKHYRHPEWDRLVKASNRFVAVSQFTPMPNAGVFAHFGYRITETPKYSHGDLCYAIIGDSMVLIAAWYDSSD